MMRPTILRLLRVSDEPARLPETEAGSRHFRAATNYYRYNLVRWLLAQASALTGLLFGLVLLRVAPRVFGQAIEFMMAVEAIAWASFLVQLPITFALLRLDYDLRWYVVSERSLRIREGLWTVREQTMTLANVQNLSIRQGPLQRLLGIADVEVHTAGGGARSSDGSTSESGMHVARFRGVDCAEDIRDLIRERVRLHRDAGLGDPDDDATTGTPGAPSGGPGRSTAAEVTAAQALLAEVRLLRSELGGGADRPDPVVYPAT